MPVDPLAGGGLPPDFAAIIARELASLAADAQTLQSRLSTGDVVHAVVLPSNGLTDLLDIGGLRVAAELPPTLVPGETIAVEVTGFTGDRINLHVLATADSDLGSPQARMARASVRVTSAATSAATTSAATTSAATTSAATTSAATTSAATTSDATTNASTTSSTATSAAGAARNNAATSTLVDGRNAAVDVARSAAVSKRVWAQRSVTSPIPGPPLTRAVPVPMSLRSIEARLATAQATTVPAEPPGTSVAAAAGKAPAPPLGTRPLIAQRVPVRATTSGAVAAAATVTPPRSPAAYTEPATLLRALHLAVTPSNVTAARIALETPHKLPRALETLERALSASTEPHAATLRTLAAFIGRIEPRSPVLATQVAAFVDHVVVGRESKIVRLLDAHAQASVLGRPADSTTAPSIGRAPVSDSLSFAAERVAIRQAAVDYDLKTQLLEVIADGRDAAGAQNANHHGLTAAVSGALTAVTALQIGAAATLAANPEGLAFTLPIAVPNGFARAQVRIDRDARKSHVLLDADNFHVGFVLETQHLGTVAIDLNTVGRSVTLSVQTEGVAAQRVFGAGLNRLTHRLEALRYRVVKADAAVAPRAPAVAPPEAAPPPADEPAASADGSHLVDLDA